MRTRSIALIASGAGLLAAAIIGIQLGESAVSEIDPVHFQGPAQPPVGIDPAAARTVVADPFASAYGWGESVPPGAAGCGGDCEARQARAAAAAFAGPVETRDAAAPYWRDVTPTTELRPWPPGQTPYRGLSVERYMHYPVNEEQAAQAAAPDPAAPPAAPAPAEEPVGD
jgi:hypothetical protein